LFEPPPTTAYTERGRVLSRIDLKKNEITVFAGKWTELEITMLRKVSWTQKNKGCIFSFICGNPDP
jgi:hypothetical protein